jgi:hypothetical protein
LYLLGAKGIIVGATAKGGIKHLVYALAGTIKHIYFPLAKSRGKVLELLRALKASDGDRQKKLFQFLNELGARALRIHIGGVLEMAESSPERYAYERKIVDRFGGQQELDLVISPAPPPPASLEEYGAKPPGV